MIVETCTDCGCEITGDDTVGFTAGRSEVYCKCCAILRRYADEIESGEVEVMEPVAEYNPETGDVE